MLRKTRFHQEKEVCGECRIFVAETFVCFGFFCLSLFRAAGCSLTAEMKMKGYEGVFYNLLRGGGSGLLQSLRGF
jgi:hypothetical protein